MRRVRSSFSLDPTEGRSSKLVRGNESTQQSTDNGESPAWSAVPASLSTQNKRTFVGCSKKTDYVFENKVGEGTFGEVHKAKDCRTKQFVALKRIFMHQYKTEGVPFTAMREIKILKQLKHKNVIPLVDLVVEYGNGSWEDLSVYMVFPYMEHDLAGLLKKFQLETPHIKAYLKQLLEGTAYLHHNKILHRDIKAANLLINNNGILKIADFGLARGMEEDAEKKYTPDVVTLWYRPPELLLHEPRYNTAIDMWGIGCVFGELLRRRPLLPGKKEMDQLDQIFSLCGSPTEASMPGWEKLPGLKGYRVEYHKRRVKEKFADYGEQAADLMDQFLTLDPVKRISALSALDHDYFYTAPVPAQPKDLPKYSDSHEYDGRKNKKTDSSQSSHQSNTSRNNNHSYNHNRHQGNAKYGRNYRNAPRA